MNTSETVIVTDTGFSGDTWLRGYAAPGAAANDAKALDLGPETQTETLASQLHGVEMIRIDFPSFADGRGFTIARRLRLMGYAGRLRAKGHVLADQYTMARRAGFDEVEISADLARRQPEDQWRARAAWRENDYLARLRG